MSTDACGRSRDVQNQPVGRLRRMPSAVRSSTTRFATGPPNAARHFSVSGSSIAAHASCGASTYGFVGSMTVASTGLSSIADGLCTR
jgi:hypothetical protein